MGPAHSLDCDPLQGDRVATDATLADLIQSLSCTCRKPFLTKTTIGSGHFYFTPRSYPSRLLHHVAERCVHLQLCPLVPECEGWLISLPQRTVPRFSFFTWSMNLHIAPLLCFGSPPSIALLPISTGRYQRPGNTSRPQRTRTPSPWRHPLPLHRSLQILLRGCAPSCGCEVPGVSRNLLVCPGPDICLPFLFERKHPGAVGVCVGGNALGRKDLCRQPPWQLSHPKHLDLRCHHRLACAFYSMLYFWL